MARSKRAFNSTPFYWKQFLWKLGLVAFLLLFLSQIAVIWLMSEQETVDAFSSGRRLIVTLENSEIEGKQISSEPTPDEAVKKTEAATPTPQPETVVNKEQSSEQPKEEEAVATPLINEEAEEELPAITPSTNPTAEFFNNLAEKSEFGYLPKISSDGTKPWKYYSKRVTIQNNKPMIAIIVTGLGSNKKISELALRLPEAINLSFSPYAKDLSSWMISGRTSGHELLIDLPMEASNYPVSDPGPLGLLISKDQAENEIKIKKLMAHNFGYVGFVTPQDEVFLDNNELFKSLLQVLSGRGLMLVIGRQPAKDDTREMIEKGNTASTIIDTIIDEELTPTAIQAHLSLLEQTAKQRGYAVGITKAYPVTIKQLDAWAAKAEENGFNLVPVSQIISKRF